MNVLTILAVGICGALGAVCRGFATEKLSGILPDSFPWPTLLINIVAACLMGWVSMQHTAPIVTAASCMGFLGGFSSMSTLNYEAVTYFTKGRYGMCFGYLALSFGACILGCALGSVLALMLR